MGLVSLRRAACNAAGEFKKGRQNDKEREGMKDDTISRQAAIDALNGMKIYRPLDSDRWVISDCINKIVNLPSAERRGRWIPCSERMPDKSGEYFITLKYDDGVTSIMLSWFYGKEKCWSYKNANVVAWMPTPEPYKEKSNE